VKNKYLKNAKISEAKYRSLVRLFSADIPALTSAGLLALNPRTSQGIYMLLRTRIILMAHLESQPLTGEMEIDESYFGARPSAWEKGAWSGWKNSCDRATQARWNGPCASR
jgi:transposase